MNNIYAYVKTIGSGSSEQNNSQDSANEPLRFILSTSEEIFPEFNLESISPVPYLPDTHLDDDNWFSIPNFSAQEYSIDIIGRKDQSNNFNFSTSDFEKLSNLNTDSLKYIFVQSQKHLFFQKITSSKVCRNTRFAWITTGYEVVKTPEFIINDIPDAVYDAESDTLYFRKLETIASIFRGIDQLFRESTDDETQQFLQSDFLDISPAYTFDKVKKQNRKRIALISKKLSEMTETDRTDLLSYIDGYYTKKNNDNKYVIENENDLKMFAYGVQERFFTQPVSRDKVVANSIMHLS